MSYQVIESQVPFEGRVFKVRVDRVQRPDGRQHRVDLVEHSGAVALLPVDDQGAIWFVRQYRHPAAKQLLELPAGTLEPGEDPQACARRECREEIGMRPGRLERLGGFYLAPGYSTEYLHVFLATRLTAEPLQPDEDEQLLVERLLPRQALDQIAAGAIEDAKSLAAMLLGLNALGLGL